MKHVALTLVLALSLGLAQTASEARKSTDAPVVVAGAIGERLDRALQEATNGMWWGAALVAREGEVLLAKGYGYADYGQKPVDANTLFEIASASKPFTAAAVLHLVQEGKLALDATLGQLWPDVPDDKRDIPVHALLTHTSGLSNRIGVPYDSPLEREDYIAHILREDVAEDVGEAFAYNNAGYAILAAVVEKVAKTSFEAYCKKHLFEPAGLRRTGFVRDPKLLRDDNVAARSGPGPAEPSAVDWHWGWGYRGMGGVVTTLHDLHRFDRALRGGKVLDDAMRAVYYEPALEGYACGWRVGTSPDGGRKVEHSGGVQGFTCQVERHLDGDVLIAVLTNQKGNPFRIADVLRKELWPPATIRAHLDVTPYTLTGARAAELGHDARWQVAKHGANRVLSLVDAKGHVAARLELPPQAVGVLRGGLEAAIRQQSRRDRDATPAMEAGVYLVNHPGGAIHDLEDGLTVQVMPRYAGMGADGKRVVDERATFVLMDTKRRSWPVMVKMNVAAAKALLAGLG